MRIKQPTSISYQQKKTNLVWEDFRGKLIDLDKSSSNNQGKWKDLSNTSIWIKKHSHEQEKKQAKKKPVTKANRKSESNPNFSTPNFCYLTFEIKTENKVYCFVICCLPKRTFSYSTEVTLVWSSLFCFAQKYQICLVYRLVISYYSPVKSFC